MRERRAGWAAGALLLAACAHVAPPPGGPEDKQGPTLLVSRPDSLAVVPGWSEPVVLMFDERISERGVRDAVVVSPSTSPVRVDQRRSGLSVSLEEGWRPGVVYHVEVRPEIQDLFGNRLAAPVRRVFSTGPAIPETRTAGEVVDRLTGKPEIGVRVEAIRTADSLVYAVTTDSAGRYDLRFVPEGEYLVRAFRDLNRNRGLDPYEPRDSARLTLVAGDSATARLAVLLPDSTPPQVASTSVAGRVIELKFDDHLEPGQTFTPGRVPVRGPDGRFLPVNRAALGELPAPDAPADTAAAAALPTQVIKIELAEEAELVPGQEYRVTVRAVRNVHGLVADAEGVLKVPPGAGAAPTELSPAGADATLPGDTTINNLPER